MHHEEVMKKAINKELNDSLCLSSDRNRRRDTWSSLEAIHPPGLLLMRRRETNPPF